VRAEEDDFEGPISEGGRWEGAQLRRGATRRPGFVGITSIQAHGKAVPGLRSVSTGTAGSRGTERLWEPAQAGSRYGDLQEWDAGEPGGGARHEVDAKVRVYRHAVVPRLAGGRDVRASAWWCAGSMAVARYALDMGAVCMGRRRPCCGPTMDKFEEYIIKMPVCVRPGSLCAANVQADGGAAGGK